MTRRTTTFGFVFLCLISLPLARERQENTDSSLDGIDDFIESTIQEWKVPGLAIGVIRDGEVLLSKGYGWRDVENSKPVTKDTLFAIGSNTKSFTVSVLGMLQDEGRVDWDEPVRSYLADFRLHDQVATVQMTPRDLVTHRSGLPRHDLSWYASGRSRQELYDTLRHFKPNKPFRSVWQYQNLMFMTAGYLAEKVAGQSWETLVDQRIFTPLGMSRSNLSVEDMQKDSNFSYPYSEVEEKVTRIPFRNIDAVGPAGSINSSVDEMLRYVRMHIDYGKYDGKQLLSENNARQMQTPQMVMTGPVASAVGGSEELGDPSYGLGLMVTSYRGHRHVRHGGGIDGFVSAMEWLPREKAGVVVLTNFSGTNPVPTIVVRNVLDRLLGLELIDWAERSRKQIAKAKEAQKESRKTAAGDRKQGTSPSHALKDFAGRYQAPGYGIARIDVEGDALKLSVVGFEVPIENYHYDVFAVPYDLPPPAGNLGGTKVLFRYDKKGDIDRVSIPLESNVDDIVFTRMADESMKRHDFLVRFVGNYELSGIVIKVALKGEDTLTMTVPGQPVYTLVPDRDTTFKLKDMNGFRVEFKADGDGEVKALISHQPNGSFRASRKKAASE